MFVIQATVAFAAAPPTENVSVFTGPYTTPPSPMDEYSFSDPSIYEAIRTELVTSGVSSVTLRSNSISTIITNKVQSLEITDLNGIELKSNDIKNIILYFPNLQSLRLENCYIASIPAEIENLFYLKELYLNNNDITDLNNVNLNNMNSLTVIELNNCKINDLRSIFNSSNISVLRLENNAITSDLIPKEINAPKLTELDLCYNKLTQTPLVFTELQMLKKLYLKGNQFEKDPSPYFSNLEIIEVKSSDTNALLRAKGTTSTYLPELNLGGYTFHNCSFFNGIFSLFNKYINSNN